MRLIPRAIAPIVAMRRHRYEVSSSSPKHFEFPLTQENRNTVELFAFFVEGCQISFGRLVTVNRELAEWVAATQVFDSETGEDWSQTTKAERKRALRGELRRESRAGDYRISIHID